jgi:hypothetical protein
MSWKGNGAKNSPESRLIEQFKAIPSNASPKRLVRKYLEFCWSLPYYGSAFFHGQVWKMLALFFLTLKLPYLFY